jgi:hypothetical protein
MAFPSDRFARAIAAFDAYHQKDPNRETFEGEAYPKELLYASRMTACLLRFAPDANEAVRLAARCQHIGRWEIPRSSYPMDRKGYLQWRNEEKAHHARIAAQILSECAYEAEMIDRVRNLLLKKELFTNPDTRLLEDVICLVFIEFYLADFAAGHEDEKVVDILRKTIRKMSPAGIKAVDLDALPVNIRSLVLQALAAPDQPD